MEQPSLSEEVKKSFEGGDEDTNTFEEALTSPSKVIENPSTLSELDENNGAPPLVEGSETPTSNTPEQEAHLSKEEAAAINAGSPMEVEPRSVGVLWGPGIVLLLVAVLFGAIVRYLQPPPMPLVGEAGSLPLTASYVTLPDGRRIAYREQGASAKDARRSLLVVHGLYSSRLAGIPGIDDDLLKEYKVRLVAYDRPGYGQSDPHPNRTLESSAYDMEAIADALGLGHKFWVLGYSGGGPHAWAAAKFIPDRLAGVALFAPSGNPFKSNMSREEIGWYKELPFATKLYDWIIPRYAPSLAPGVFHNLILPRLNKSVESLPQRLGEKDKALLELPEFFEEMKRDIHESLRQQHGLPVAQELTLTTHSWGFHLSELEDISTRGSFTLSGLKRFIQRGRERRPPFNGPIHLWQGTDDVLVNKGMALYAKRRVPRIHLHLLDNEGHFSWFCWCESCHRQVMEALFGVKAYRH